jgi:MFS family permease
MNELYLSVAIRSFAISMIGIFIPIYLLQIGYQLQEVFWFFIVVSLTQIFFAIPAAHIASRFGFKHSILFSVLPLILSIAGFYSLEQFSWLFYLVAVLVGFAGDLYWISYHIDFSLFSDHDHRGREVGMAQVAALLFHVLGPIMGGYLLVSSGFHILFLMVSVLLVVSVVPLFFTEDRHQPWKLSLRELFKNQSLRDAVVFMAHGIEIGAGLIVWPIFIFYSVLNDYSALGFITSLSLFLSLIFTFAVGSVSDGRKRLVLRIGTILNALVWMGRYLVQTVFQVAFVDSLYGASQTLIRIPFNAMTYDKANKVDIVKYVVSREIAVHTGRIVLFSGLLFFVPLGGSLIIVGAISLLYLIF